MRTPSKLVLVISVICLFSIWSAADEKRIKFSQLPPAVQSAAKEQSKGATVHGYSTETEHGKTVYEVEMTVNGHSKDVSFDSTGAVVEVEEQVALASIPAAAQQGLQREAGKGKVTKVEAVSTGNGQVDAYEAEVRRMGKKSEVRVGPDGNAKPEQD